MAHKGDCVRARGEPIEKRLLQFKSVNRFGASTGALVSAYGFGLYLYMPCVSVSIYAFAVCFGCR